MGPCLCGDPYCPSCGDGSAALFEALWDDCAEAFPDDERVPVEWGSELEEQCHDAYYAGFDTGVVENHTDPVLTWWATRGVQDRQSP